MRLLGGLSFGRRGLGQRQESAEREDSAHLIRWMDKRRRLGINARHPVFCTFSKVAGEPSVWS